MKRYILALFVILSCLFFAPLKTTTQAETNEINFNTLYPENIIDYKDLSNISKLTVNDKYIAYTQDNTNLNIYDTQTKNTYTITNLSNIVKVKFANNLLIIITTNGILYTSSISNTNSTTLNSINTISFEEIKAADIYVSDTEIFLGFVDKSTFKLYEFNLNLTTSKSNPTKTIQHSSFEDTYLLTINDKSAYIISNEASPTMYIQNYTSNEVLTTSLKVNYQSIDTFYQNNQEYILTFTGENLRLLNPSCEELSTITINEFDEIFLKISDIDYFNNTIYVSDNNHNSIQTYSITTDEQLKTEKILICSSSKELGRFNNASNILSIGNDLIISDTLNNRIQVIKENIITNNSEENTVYKSTSINISSDTNLNPKSVNLDSKGNLYFITNSATNSQVYKYSTDGSTYNYETFYEKNGLNNIGYLSDITITNEDTLYMLDYTNNKLLYISNKGIEEKTTLPFGINENSKIEFIKELNLFTILNNNVLHILSNTSSITLLDSISINGSAITCDINSIHVLTNDTIKLVKISSIDDSYFLEISTEKLTDNHILEYSSIFYNISSRIMYAFNTNRQCIEYFELDLQENPFDLYDITIENNLTPTSTLIPITLQSAPIIYEYPYSLGKSYNYTGLVESAFIIEDNTYSDYYRILFNNNNELTAGYIKKIDAPDNTHLDFIDRKINVVTINQQVPIYKYPTLLKANNQAITIGTLPINTTISLSAESPISIDGKKFFMYKNNGIIGFIFNADVVLNESTHIEYLKNTNATIKTYDKLPTMILEEDKTTQITQIDNLERIYVEDYDKNSEYTKVTYKTPDLQTIEGYVLTKYIQMDKLDNSKIVIICIIIFSVILLGIIISCYIVIKKKKN